MEEIDSRRDGTTSFLRDHLHNINVGGPVEEMKLNDLADQAEK